MAIRQRLVRDYPSVTEYQSDLAKSHNQIGNLLTDTGQPTEALKWFRRSLELRERLAADNPTVTIHQSELANASDNIGTLLKSIGQAREALELHSRALVIRERLAKDNRMNPTYQDDLGGTLRNVAELEMGEQHWREAQKLLERAIEKQQTALAAMPRHPAFHRGLVQDLLDSMKVFLALEEPEKAIRVRRELLSLPRENPDDYYDIACALALSVSITPAEERHTLSAEAVQTLQQAVAAGWSDARRTSRDNDLACLRDREDFGRLLADMFDRSFPADPFAK